LKAIGDRDLVLIVHKDRRYLKRAEAGKSFHGKGGIIEYSLLFGHRYGTWWGEYQVFEPTMEDILMYGVRRETQIVFPKDGFFICFKLDLRNGSRLLEVGAGSGALTCLFSRMVGPAGRVVSFEKEDRHYRNAKKNIEQFAEWSNVELHHSDATGLAEGYFDAVFIDVREPWLHFSAVRDRLKPSGPIGTIVPTANQISDTLRNLYQGFGDIEVLELMLRKYKTVADRVRPEDRMVAHTGYLVFARKLENQGDVLSNPQGTEA
jgi:tRNA (adenine57-N1/adenine58-N1)-methyltransferase catalytic subunit